MPVVLTRSSSGSTGKGSAGSSPGGIRKPKMLAAAIGVLVLVLLLAAGGYWLLGGSKASVPSSTPSAMPEAGGAAFTPPRKPAPPVGAGNLQGAAAPNMPVDIRDQTEFGK
ncbi:MAG: hypothetical protein ACP5VE_03110 [Chthonomonadales bacterium]